MQPRVLTFDVFGTLVDWREGLRRDLLNHGIPLEEDRWESILADQERAEKISFQPYSEIMTWSLARRLGLPRPAAERIARDLGNWPFFPDTLSGLSSLATHVRCVAMTNSDRRHGQQIQDRLGFSLSAWVCAEEVRVYKPDPAFWVAVGERLGLKPGKNWWHVSAYADYDLATAASLGLTTVLVRRPHHRAGPADLVISGLDALAMSLRNP